MWIKKIFRRKKEKLNPEINRNINGTDVLLTLLYSKGAQGIINEPIGGFTKLDKMLFLLNKTEAFANLVDFEFDHENYGPYSAEAFDMTEVLIICDVIKVKAEYEPHGRLNVIDEITVEE